MSQHVPRVSRPDQWTHRGPREAWGSIFTFRPGVTLVHQRSTLKTAICSLSIISVIYCWSPTLSPMVQCLLLFLGLLWSLYNPDRRWTHISWCNSVVTWLSHWLDFQTNFWLPHLSALSSWLPIYTLHTSETLREEIYQHKPNFSYKRGSERHRARILLV